MWTEPVVTVAAASEPVSLAEAKAHCRVTSSDHDTVLGVYISAARDFAEKYTGLAIAAQTVTFARRSFASTMPLPIAPVASISSVSYQDADNATQTLAGASYVLSGANTLRPVLSLSEGQSWPSLYNAPEAVTVTAVVGYSAVPDALKQAILLMVGHWFDNRETVSENMSEPPFATTALLENYRTF